MRKRWLKDVVSYLRRSSIMRKFAAISLAGIMAFGALPVMAEETSTEEAQRQLPRLAVRQLSQIR